MAQTLAEALGHPAPWAFLPTKRSQEWPLVVRDLEEFVGSPHLLAGRGPVWLWKQLQCSAAPRRLTWGALLNGWERAAAAEVFEALTRRPTSVDVTIFSWNARWLVDQASLRVAAKRRRG